MSSILLIEDDDLFRDALANALTELGYLKMAGVLGANRTLQKPFDLPTLPAAIAEVLAETDKLHQMSHSSDTDG